MPTVLSDVRFQGAGVTRKIFAHAEFFSVRLIVAASRLTCRSVANIVKEYAGRAGFDAAIFSAHSLRSGFLTSAAAKGASIFKMMDQSGHKSIDTLRGYVRDAELFKDHAGAGLL
jgi:site-specific recombinase XerD